MALIGWYHPGRQCSEVAKSCEGKHQTKADLEGYVVVDGAADVDTSKILLQTLDRNDIVAFAGGILRGSNILLNSRK
jgi:hypothetical protein